jgi:hypothetical protein
LLKHSKQITMSYTTVFSDAHTLNYGFHTDFDDISWRIFTQGNKKIANYFIDVARYGKRICIESFCDEVVDFNESPEPAPEGFNEAMFTGMYILLMDTGSIEPADVLTISSYLREDEECWDDVILKACGRK